MSKLNPFYNGYGICYSNHCPNSYILVIHRAPFIRGFFVSLRMTTEDILNKAGALTVRKLKESFDIKNLNDTGRAKDSLAYQVTGNTLIITGLARILFLEFGRKPGTMPPIEPIQEWVERKLNVDPSESRGVAFAIAKKIKDKGTDILTDRAKGLQIELTLAQINKLLLQSVTNQLTLELTSGLAKVWQSGESNILE